MIDSCFKYARCRHTLLLNKCYFMWFPSYQSTKLTCCCKIKWLKWQLLYTFNNNHFRYWWAFHNSQVMINWIWWFIQDIVAKWTHFSHMVHNNECRMCRVPMYTFNNSSIKKYCSKTRRPFIWLHSNENSEKLT